MATQQHRAALHAGLTFLLMNFVACADGDRSYQDVANTLARAGMLGAPATSTLRMATGVAVTITSAAGRTLVVNNVTGDLGLCDGDVPVPPLMLDCADPSHGRWEVVEARIRSWDARMLLICSLGTFRACLRDAGGIVARSSEASKVNQYPVPGSLTIVAGAVETDWLRNVHLQWTISHTGAGSSYFISSFFGRYLEVRNGTLGFMHETVAPGAEQMWTLTVVEPPRPPPPTPPPFVPMVPASPPPPSIHRTTCSDVYGGTAIMLTEQEKVACEEGSGMLQRFHIERCKYQGDSEELADGGVRRHLHRRDVDCPSPSC